MKQNPFVFCYNGSKRREVETIYECLKDKLENVDTIIEPFCGTSSMSVFIAIKHPLKYKYILNDMNTRMIELYRLMMDKEKFSIFVNEFNEAVKTISCKENYDILVKKDDFLGWFIGSIIRGIRPNLYVIGYKPKVYNFDELPVIKFLRTENVSITATDGTNVLKKYQDDTNCLLLLDPPYLMSCNFFYDKECRGEEIYEYCVENCIGNMKAKILFILEDNWILKFFFKGYITETYDKKYETKQRKTKHVSISNMK